MNVTILGCGVYGRALSTSFLENDVNLMMWSKFDKEVNELKEDYSNVLFTTDLDLAIKDADLIVIAIPVAFLEETMQSLKNCYSGQDILIASKGIDVETQLFAYEIVEKYLEGAHIGVISGGTFAVDMNNKKIMGLTLGTKSDIIKEKVQKSLENSFLKIQYTDDLIGVSVCGAIKNVMAIGFGMLDGALYPESSRFLFLTEAIYEIKLLIEKLDGDPNTIMSYAGIDDIMMTCTSSKSRNYSFGSLIGKGSSLKEIEEYKKNTTIEGLGTSATIYRLCLGKNINLPIACAIYQILYENAPFEIMIDCLKGKNY